MSPADFYIHSVQVSSVHYIHLHISNLRMWLQDFERVPHHFITSGLALTQKAALQEFSVLKNIPRPWKCCTVTIYWSLEVDRTIPAKWSGRPITFTVPLVTSFSEGTRFSRRNGTHSKTRAWTPQSSISKKWTVMGLYTALLQYTTKEPGKTRETTRVRLWHKPGTGP